MTLDQLNDSLDGMEQAAGGDASLMAGLITINAELWVRELAEMRAPCKALHDGMRYRDVVVHISSQAQTAVLSRTQAGQRGEPYREMSPRV